MRRLPHRWAAVAIAAVLVSTGCSDEGDDLSPAESEVGEGGTEIVPGEGGPVD